MLCGFLCAAVPVESQKVLLTDLCVDACVSAGVVWSYGRCCVFLLFIANLKLKGNCILRLFFTEFG